MIAFARLNLTHICIILNYSVVEAFPTMAREGRLSYAVLQGVKQPLGGLCRLSDSEKCASIGNSKERLLMGMAVVLAPEKRDH